MLKPIIACLVLALAFPSLADDKLCANIGVLAGLVMTLRQKGAPLSDALENAKDIKVLREIVFDAYESPRYSTEQHQERSIADFRDTWQLRCLRSH